VGLHSALSTGVRGRAILRSPYSSPRIICSETPEGLLNASVRAEARPQLMGGCIEIRRVGCCAYGVDFTRSPSAARWVYATIRTSIAPSGSSRTAKESAVVAIGVGRRRVGRDNSSVSASPAHREDTRRRCLVPNVAA
jgi:hypothetical protein